MDPFDHYEPSFSDEYAQQMRAWHERAYEEMRSAGDREVSYLGLDLIVPADVFPPQPMSQLLGKAVLDEVTGDDRVLDMGTGSGVNALLAASKAKSVVGVDINPIAVDAAKVNAMRNGVAERTVFFESDVFSQVDGEFDMIIFDPPFRWFTPRDILEVSMADPGYAALTRFMAEAKNYLTPDGRILMFFGSSGDLDYLRGLMRTNGFHVDTLATRELQKEGLTVSYFAFRLRP